MFEGIGIKQAPHGFQWYDFNVRRGMMFGRDSRGVFVMTGLLSRYNKLGVFRLVGSREGCGQYIWRYGEETNAELCDVFTTIKGNQFIYWRDEEADEDYITKIERKKNHD